MSVIGVDFGNLSLLIGMAGKGGIDVILNDSSNRQTATAVSIQGKQRFLGDAAAALARSNIYNTITCMKLLIGRKYDCAAVQRELKNYPYKTSKLPHGGVGINLTYNDETIVVPVEHVLAMMLVKAKEIAFKANNNVNVAESVLAVPFWYTDAQRRGMLRACEIAALPCLKVTNEANAIALSYGIFKSAKKLFSETEPTNVMFIDLGYSHYCVSVVEFKQEHMRVLSTKCNYELGGRNFDDCIIDYIIENFQKKTKVDVRGNWKSLLKMQVAAEKAKKTLSPNGVNEANISIECLHEEQDFNGILTKEEFEKRIAPLIDQLEAPVVQALQEAGLTMQSLADVEIVGGSTRVNIVKKRLAEILQLDMNAMGYGLKTTMNSDEAVARGSALQCALLSSRMKVKTFNILDRLPYTIVAHYDPTPTNSSSSSSAAMDTSDAAADAKDPDGKEEVDMTSGGNTVTLFQAGGQLPHPPRRMTFKRKTSDFTITLKYDEASMKTLPEGEDSVIGKYTIKVPSFTPGTGGVIPDIRVNFNIDKHGCVYCSSAQQMEEYFVDEPVPPATPATGTPAAGAGTEEKKDESKDTSAPPTTIKKRKFKKIELEIVSDVFVLPTADLKACIELEATMANEDRLIVETADKRNELESYLYSMRDKLDKSLKGYCVDKDREKLKTLMTTTEDWLYNEGFDSTKFEYTKKLDELRLLSNPIENRLYESENRGNAIDSLKKQLDLCKSFASNYDEKYSHISEDDRTKLRDAIKKAESWLYDIQAQQGDLPLHTDPVLTIQAISKTRNELFTVSNPIMTKPKPAPAPTPASTSTNSNPPPESKDNSGKEDVPMDQEGAAAGESKDQQSDTKMDM